SNAWVDHFVKEPTEAAAVRARFATTLATGKSYNGLREIVLASGETRWFAYAADPILDRDGKVVAIVGSTQDVTEEHAVQTALALSEERFRMITENMQDIVTLHDPSGRLTYASPSLQRQLGHGFDISTQRMPDNYVHPDDLNRVKRTISQFMADTRPCTTIEYRLRKRDGEYAWLETHCTRVTRGDQTLSHFQALTHDVTDRKAAELALAKRTDELSVTNTLLVEASTRRQELERRVLLSIENALHQVGLELHDDLGQQLTGISLLAKTLENKLTSFPPHAERSTARDAARIAELVNRAINHTRMISHGLSPYLSGEFGLAVALTQLAGDIDSLGVVACVARIDGRVKVSDEIAARSLFRIAQEAANNSLKHSGATLIQISLKTVGDYLQLTIGDDGTRRELPPDQTDIQVRGCKGCKGGKGSNGNEAPHSIRHRCQSIGARVAYRYFAGAGTFVCIRWQQPATGRQGDSQPATISNLADAATQF
ncbi:MAG: PAS domain S-box protein, partial [Aeromicrobium sp.]|nr:PAS domain S-box protein [Burkholderiales bacterium]